MTRTVEGWATSELELERSLLAGMLAGTSEEKSLMLADGIDPEWVEDATVRLFIEAIQKTRRPRDFQAIFAACREMVPDNVVGQVDNLAGYVADLVENSLCPTRSHSESIALAEKHFLRRRRELLADKLISAADDEQKYGEVINEIHQLGSSQTCVAHVSDGDMELMDDWLKNPDAGVIKSGYGTIDNHCPLEKSNIFVIAGTPGAGKTSFGLNVALNASKNGSGVLVVSLEMTKSELMQKLKANVARVNANKLKRRNFHKTTEAERKKLIQAVNTIGNLPIRVEDSFTGNPHAVAALARAEMHSHPYDVLFVDYVQLMSGNAKYGTQAQEIAEITRTFKKLSRELDIAVIIASQLNRGGYSSNTTSPGLENIKASSSIAEDGSVVVMLYEDEDAENVINMKVTKNRHGEKDFICRMLFQGQFADFKELSEEESLGMGLPGYEVGDIYEAVEGF